MAKRFITKKVKIVWRNSMLAGNPISRSFTKFGVYDCNWQNDGYCWSPNPGGSFVQDWQARQYRIVVDDESKASRIAAKLNELATAIGGEECAIEFGVSKLHGVYPLNSYIHDEDIEHIVITKAAKKSSSS